MIMLFFGKQVAGIAVGVGLMLALGACNGEVAQLPIVRHLEAGENKFKIHCPTGQFLARVYPDGYSEGLKTGPIKASGRLTSGKIDYPLRGDENPSVPEGMSRVYQVWVQVRDGEIDVSIEIESGEDVVLVIGRTKP